MHTLSHAHLFFLWHCFAYHYHANKISDYLTTILFPIYNTNAYNQKQCTFVCTWNPPNPPPPTPSPTLPPQYPSITTEHPILLIIRNLPSDYTLTPDVRASILRYIQTKLMSDIDNLNINMKVMDVTNTGERLIGNNPHSIPLKVTVTAPSDISDFALSYITQVLRDNITIITENLQRLDGTFSFNDVALNIDTYDWNDVLMFGMNTMTPTKVPTAAPPEPVVEIVDESSSSDGIPWWVWILVVLAILGCMTVVCCCYCYYKNDEEDEYRMNNSKERQINMFVHNRMHTTPPSKNDIHVDCKMEMEEIRRHF